MTCSRSAIVAGVVLLAVARIAAAGEPSVDRLAWMAGTWTGTDRGIEMIEHWTDPKGGLMLGIHRDVKQGKAVFFEFLRIEATPKGIVYLASPKGAPATPFPMVELGDSRVVFENPEHDFPKRITYRLTPDGSLKARVEGVEKGRATAEEWIWRRR